jgi:hypothetical protein
MLKRELVTNDRALALAFAFALQKAFQSLDLLSMSPVVSSLGLDLYFFFKISFT